MPVPILRFYSNSVWYTTLFGKFYPREQNVVRTYLRGHEKVGGDGEEVGSGCHLANCWKAVWEGGLLGEFEI